MVHILSPRSENESGKPIRKYLPTASMNSSMLECSKNVRPNEVTDSRKNEKNSRRSSWKWLIGGEKQVNNLTSLVIFLYSKYVLSHYHYEEDFLSTRIGSLAWKQETPNLSETTERFFIIYPNISIYEYASTCSRFQKNKCRHARRCSTNRYGCSPGWCYQPNHVQCL